MRLVDGKVIVDDAVVSPVPAPSGERSRDPLEWLLLKGVGKQMKVSSGVVALVESAKL